MTNLVITRSDGFDTLPRREPTRFVSKTKVIWDIRGYIVCMSSSRGYHLNVALAFLVLGMFW
jgi:hypothetical protein